MVFGRRSLHQGWLESAENPANDPTREVDLRSPENLPEVQHLLGPEPGTEYTPGWRLEVFPGTADLSRPLPEKGLRVGRPLEAYPAGGGYDKLSDLASRDIYEKLPADIRSRNTLMCTLGARGPPSRCCGVLQ